MADHEGGSGLKLYVHLGSQPCRVVTIFCRANHVEAQEVFVDLPDTESRTEYKKIIPMGLIPGIDDDGFKLVESHAILRYLATTRNVADHWYPKDPKKRALVDAALDWHQVNLRRYCGELVRFAVLAKLPAYASLWPDTDHAAFEADSRKSLPGVLDKVEFMLQQGKYLQGAEELSIADLSLVCDLTHLQFLSSKDRESLLGHRERIAKWMADVEDATRPHFKDVHDVVVMPSAKKLEELRSQGDSSPGK